MNNIAIVGGGPAGIYCALNILEKFKKNNFTDYSLTIFDKAPILRTLLLTGGGRCNLTNSISDIKEFASNYPRGEKFLYSLFFNHFNSDSLEFFSSIGIDTYIQNAGRIFPISNSAKDVRDKMINYLNTFKNFKIINKRIVCKNQLNNYDYIILSCGSKDSFELIKSYNHTCFEFKKSLCALNIDTDIYPQGVSVHSCDGDFVFTKNGVSGPLIFRISSLKSRDEFPYKIKIKLFDVDDLIQKINENPKKTLGNIVSMFIPKSLAHIITDKFDNKASEISRKYLDEISILTLNIVSCANAGEIVNSGGVDLNELNKNCKSKLVKNLWFCGEILNIDGFCGGFNLQNCWSSAYVVSVDIVNEIIK